MENLTIGVFGATAPMLVGRALRFFEQEGVSVTWDRVRSSTQQFLDLASGRYDLLETAFDNVIFYALSAANVTQRKLPVKAFASLDGGMDLGVSTRRGISGFEDLRGGSVSVDAPHTGYAFVLYELLEQNGLVRTRDYNVVEHGAIAKRYDQLLQGHADATLLNYGYETLAARQGCGRLARSRDHLFPYLGSVLAALDHVIDGHAAALQRFLTAYRRALDYVANPAHAADVIARISQGRGISEADAEVVLRSELSDVGLSRDVDHIDPAAASTVIRLRVKNGGLDLPAGETRTAGLVDQLTTRLG
ncbi:MAG TPA: ABC transporter substrate-binding protein [Rhodanobacteraceae bacterium]